MPPMRKKPPHQASPDEVRITREGETAIIEFADPGISVSRVRIGPTLATMTDDEILDLFNAMLAAQAEIAAEFDSTAVDHVSRGQRPVGAARSGSLQLYRG